MMTTEIRARITANAAGFSAGLRDAERQVAGFQSRIERSFRGLNRLGAGLAGLAGGGLAAGALDQLTRSALNSAGAIADAARAAGVGAETLQEYRAAAKLAGIEQETLDSALQVFSRSLGDARRGNDSLADTFRRIGVTASDTAEGALDKTFSALAGIRDETVRASVAQDVFGRSGVRLAALVADGADSLAEARKQARELGLVLSNETVRGADAAGDRIEFLDAQMRTRLQTTILQNIEGFESYHSLLNDLSRAAVQFAARLGPAATAIQNFYDAVRGAGLPADASLSRLIEERETIASEIKNAAEGAQRGRELAEAAPFSFGAARDFADARQRRAGELSQQLRQIDRAIAEARAAQNALQKTITQGAGGEGDGDGFGDLGAPGAVGRFAGIEGPTLKIDAFNKRLADSQARIDAIAESIRTPFEELRAQLAEIDALRPFAENAEQANALSAAAAGLRDRMRELSQQTSTFGIQAEDALRGFSDAVANAIVNGENLLGTLKRLVAQLAVRALANFLFNSIGNAFGIPISGGLATGGPAQAGRTYLVGEQGPELFTPGVSGTVIPNGAIMGGGVSVQVINRFDVGLESVNERIQTMTPAIAASVVGAVQRAQSRPRFA